MTYREFIRQQHLTLRSEWADRNPNIDDDAHMGSHFRVTLRMGRRSMVTYFSMGRALTGEPKLEDVLDCLASDASGYENSPNFEDWAGEYGYDADSRSAERIFNTVRNQSERLQHFLGQDAYNALLWDTERL